MSRRSALSRPIVVAPGPLSYPRARRGNRVRTRLVSEVVELAFDRCEGADSDCSGIPDGICAGCGTVRCSEHTATPTSDVRACTDCGGRIHELLTAAVEVVLDARFRRRTR